MNNVQFFFGVAKKEKWLKRASLSTLSNMFVDDNRKNRR
jgi:hypothetical protein